MKPGYKNTEIGVIPEEWEVKMLGDEFDVQLGKMLDVEKNRGTLVPYIGNKAVQWGFIDLSSVQEMAMTSEELTKYRLVRGDLLVCEGGEVGRCAIWSDDLKECYYQKAIHRLRSLRGFEPLFMLYLLQRWSHSGLLLNYSAQTSIAHLTKEKLITIPLPVPPLPEQRAIASALSDIDALLAAQDRLIAKKRDLKTAAMQSLLSGKQRLPGFTGAWVERKLGECFTFLSTANYSRAALGKNGPVGYIHYGDIHKSNKAFFNLSLMSLPTVTLNMVQSYALVEDGDLIMADASEDLDGIGKCIEVKGIGSAKVIAGLHTFLMRGRPELLAQGFRGYLQQMPNFRAELIKLASGISVYGISKSSVGSVSLKLPPLDEQRAIAQVLSDMDAEIEALEAQRDKTAQLKQGMMQTLLTGETRLV